MKFKIKISRETVLLLKRILQAILEQAIPETEDERLFLAVCDELNRILYRKLEDLKEAYKLTLTPAQAIIIRMLNTYYSNQISYYEKVEIQTIADAIHQSLISSSAIQRAYAEGQIQHHSLH